MPATSSQPTGSQARASWVTFTSVRSRPTSSVRDVRCEAVPLLGDLGDVGCDVGLQLLELSDEAGCLFSAASTRRSEALVLPRRRAAWPASPRMSPIIPPLDFLPPSNPPSTDPAVEKNSELRLAFASSSAHVGTVLGGVDLVTQPRCLGLVLVAKLGDVLVGALVGERGAARGELLGRLAGAPVQLQVGVRRDLQGEAAGEVIAQVALDLGEERLGGDLARRSVGTWRRREPRRGDRGRRSRPAPPATRRPGRRAGRGPPRTPRRGRGRRPSRRSGSPPGPRSPPPTPHRASRRRRRRATARPRRRTAPRHRRRPRASPSSHREGRRVGGAGAGTAPAAGLGRPLAGGAAVAGGRRCAWRRGVSVAIWSRVIGPRRYDIAQRVVKISGWSLPARRSMNSRLPSPEIVASTADTSTLPAADDMPVEQSGLVALGLQAADHPGAGVRHRLVVEVDRVLRRQHHPDPERPGLLHQRHDRLLRRRHSRWAGGSRPPRPCRASPADRSCRSGGASTSPASTARAT